MPHFSVRHFDQQIIPFADSPDLVWLWPSKQIRAPLFSIKQKKLRRGIVSAIVAHGESNSRTEFGKQVIRYGIFYAAVICVFAALIALRTCSFLTWICRKIADHRPL